MKMDLIYETPKVEIIEVQVERGFASSYDGIDPDASFPGTDPWE